MDGPTKECEYRVEEAYRVEARAATPFQWDSSCTGQRVVVIGGGTGWARIVHYLDLDGLIRSLQPIPQATHSVAHHSLARSDSQT